MCRTFPIVLFLVQYAPSSEGTYLIFNTWLFVMLKKSKPEACFIVPRQLYRRVSKLTPFVNRTAFLRLIIGKRHVYRVKLVSSDKWPRKDTKSYEFCLKLKERLDRIEQLAKEIHKIARGH